MAKASSMKEPRNIYFSFIDELDSIDEAQLASRKAVYKNNSHLSFPRVLTNIPFITQSQLQGVSLGRAIGAIKSAEQILPTDRDIILYTKILSPDLTRFFPNITGIISEQGGMLSHLAIIAREKGIPLIVNYEGSLPVGSKVTMDADKGTIDLIKPN